MLLMSAFEIVGTIAFAISGALVGIKKQLDIFGVCFLAVTTAVGGGIFRDMILANNPPAAFKQPLFCFISIAAALIAAYYYQKIIMFKNIILVFDAIGLGVFTAIGSFTAINHGMNQPFIVITMGLITGIGGGILRDVFTQDIPLVFKKEIYAIASIMGSASLYLSNKYLYPLLSLYICFIVTSTIRILAIRFSINLPVLNTEDLVD